MALTDKLTAIADAIRNKTNTTSLLTLPEMPTMINSIVTPVCLDWAVENISGAIYGFTLNNNGYYESTNKGIQSSYSLCKVSFNIPEDGNTYIVTVDCINYAESNYDFGILSNIDTTLSLSNTADTTNVKKSFQGLSSANVQTLNYGVVDSGEHYIYVKYRKDGSADSGNDSLQFKLVISNGMIDASDATASSEDIVTGKTAYVGGSKVTGTIATQPAKTITPGKSSQTAVAANRYTTGNVTVAGDSNLKSENIKSGVSIFGISGTLTSTTVTIDGQEYEGDSLSLIHNYDWVTASTPPTTFGSAVSANTGTEIHFIGGDSNIHYKWDGSSWTRISTANPYKIMDGCAVSLNGYIHILGGRSTSSTDASTKYHYKWTGSAWTKLSTLPYKFTKGKAIVADHQIHILGTNRSDAEDYKAAHYKWDGSSWTSVSTLPFTDIVGITAELNGVIWIISNTKNSGYYSIKYFNKVEWRNTNPAPATGALVMLDDDVCIVNSSAIYKGTGSDAYNKSWRQCSSFAVTISGDKFIYDGKLHIIYNTSTLGVDPNHVKFIDIYKEEE